jgi:hypothetical protein
MRTFVVSALIAAGLAAGAASPAFAQAGVYIGPGGVGVDVGRPGYREDRRDYRDDRRDFREERRGGREDIGPRQARRIAYDNGIREIYSVDRRGPFWEVRGEGRRGRMTVRVNSFNGDVVIRR